METLNQGFEHDYKAWLKQHDKFVQLFPQKIVQAPDYHKTRLNDLNRILAKHLEKTGPENQTMRKLIEIERKEIRKLAYPNWWSRTANVIGELLSLPKMAKAESLLQEKNLNTVKERMTRSGFGDHVEQAKNQMLSGAKEISLSTPTYQVTDKESMKYELFLENNNGGYDFAKYRVFLSKEGDKEKSIQHTFKLNTNYAVTPEQAYNLISGRPILVDYYLNGARKTHWVRLDLNDKDAQGNFKEKIFVPELQIDFNRELGKLDIKDMSPTLNQQLTKNLQNGNRVEVTILSGDIEKKIFLEPNPSGQSISLSNEKGIPIKESIASENKRLLVVHKNLKKAKGQKIN